MRFQLVIIVVTFLPFMVIMIRQRHPFKVLVPVTQTVFLVFGFRSPFKCLFRPRTHSTLGRPVRAVLLILLPPKFVVLMSHRSVFRVTVPLLGKGLLPISFRLITLNQMSRQLPVELFRRIISPGQLH